MSAFKQNMRKLSIRAGVLAGASAAVLAISGIGAGSAVAATTCPEAGAFKGEGSSLQKVGQEAWNKAYDLACEGTTNHPTVTYTSSSSGTALKGWGSEGGGAANPHTNQYIGTDEAPNATQITNIKTAAGTGSHVQVVPVAQAAIAMIVNPPAGCTITKITQANLQEVWQGKLKEWSELANKSGTCSGAITRVVRLDGSGTSYQFKHFLFDNNSAALKCSGLTKGGTKRKWSELQSGTTNLEWPEKAKCGTVAEEAEIGALLKATETGGGGEVTTVEAEHGRIGYVDLATAKSKSAHILEVENETGHFESPAVAGGAHKANCLTVAYTVPSGARGTGASDINWSAVYGSSTSVPNNYPICTLTWDVAFTDYSTAGYTSGGGVVKDYLRNYVLEGGQTKLEEEWYAPLPSTPLEPVTDVLGAAKLAAAAVTQ